MVTNDRTWLGALATIAVSAMAVGCTFDREGKMAPEGGVPQVDAATEAGVDAKEPVACLPPNKLCGEVCAELDDPAFGCAPGTCKPCEPRPQGVMGCSNKECVITDCEESHWNCNGDPRDGCEVDLWSMDHCGACGKPCVLPSAESVCNQGSCEVGECHFGWGNCDQQHETGCETGLRDNVNCGECGNPCIVTGGEGTCATGKCLVDVCDPGRENCNDDISDGCETDLSTLQNCGACGVVCDPPNAVGTCTTGTCQIASCVPGFGDCNKNPLDGCETNIRQNVDHCGGCDDPCEGANVMSRACSDGLCVPTCQSGWKDCNGPQPGGTDDGCERDVYTLTSCGDCDVTCDPLNAVGDCSSGVCLVGACLSGWANCNFFVWGCETHVAVDLSNCGKCGNACATRPNSTPTCSTGVCTLNCQAGWGNCNNEYDDGCETNTTTNTSHCGACGEVCPNPAHALGYCEASACKFACDAGWGDCNFLPGDGCEADLSSPSHCGSCGNSCPVRDNAARTCDQGVCGFTCNDGWADCNGQAGDGCEANLGAITSCGACGVTCPTRPNATTTCDSAQCGFDCVGGWDNCNAQAADGCETNVTLTSNCGTCGNVCTVGPNGTATCVNGQCDIDCATGWDDCNEILADGCEADLSRPAHCGICANECPPRPNASTTCTNGTCGFACSTEFDNCDGVASNGCEVTLATDTSHCGTCNNVCPVPAHATAACVSGACGFNCQTDWGNCDDSSANGCESDLTSDPDHCGSCTTACPSGGAHTVRGCANNTCTLACEPNWQDCNDDLSDGCECGVGCCDGMGGCTC